MHPGAYKKKAEAPSSQQAARFTGVLPVKDFGKDPALNNCVIWRSNNGSNPKIMGIWLIMFGTLGGAGNTRHLLGPQNVRKIMAQGH